jgi:hypothetical protein
MIKRLALLALLITASLARASTYYVTNSGAGTHDGANATSAWSLADFNDTDKPTGGDTVRFTGTFTTALTPSGNGTGAAKLILDLRGATLNKELSLRGKHDISVVGGTASPTAANQTINLNGSSNIDIDGYVYESTSTSGTTSFAQINNCNYITISNCRAVNCAYGFVGDKNHFITLTGNDILTSQNSTVQTDIIHFGSATDVIIEKNKFVLRAPGNASVRHNDVIQTYRSGASGGFDSQNWIIRYNWIENDCVQPSSDGNASWTMMEALVGNPAIKVYSNVFTSPSLTGGGGANNGIRDNKNPGAGDTHYLYNNTIIKRANPGNVIYYLAPGKAIWKNNILWCPEGFPSGNPNSTMTTTADYNYFYRNGSNFTGPHGSGTTDPLLKDPENHDYSLQANSPCIGAADNTIGAEYAYGIAPGSTWPNPTVVARTGAWDVGAFVSNAGPRPSPTPSPSATPAPSPTASPTPGNKFALGDYVTPTKLVNIRQSPAGIVVGTHDVGDVGQIVGGPTVAALNGVSVNWYDMEWGSDPLVGWVGDDNLELTAKPQPTPTPTPTPTPGPSATPTPGSPTYEKWIENQNNWIRANPPKPD